MSNRRLLCLLTLALLALAPAAARAVTLQPLGQFDEPIYVTSDPGTGEHLFVVERGGLIEQLHGGVVSPFADLRAVVGCGGVCSGERGLLSIALAPDFDSSGKLFVDYASDVDGTIHVAEMRATRSGASTATLRDLLVIPHPGESNHNGGQLQFGPDGDLYVSTGDGGGADDQHHNAQSLSSLLGKILRIDPDPGGVLPYRTPAGNPFPGSPAPFDTIWSYGLRNPFRFSFDSAGAMVIGDVGQNQREEVDFAPAGSPGGANYGWNCREGLLAGPGTDPGCAEAKAGAFASPVFDYPHTDPGGGAAHGCAIIGGYVVHDPSLPALFGRYLYGDLCSGELRSLDLAAPAASDRSEGISVNDLNSFGEDACGRLYVVSGSGQVARLVGDAPQTCPLAPSFTAIKTVSRHVKRGKRALITAGVTPCGVRPGEPVGLYLGRRRVATRHLDRACTARFRPRVGRRSTFRAKIESDGDFEASTSRPLRIRPMRPRHRHRRR
jgi:hypothetical protein